MPAASHAPAPKGARTRLSPVDRRRLEVAAQAWMNNAVAEMISAGFDEADARSAALRIWRAR